MFSSQEEVFEKEKKYILKTYKRPRVVLQEGKGATVKDWLRKEEDEASKICKRGRMVVPFPFSDLTYAARMN